MKTYENAYNAIYDVEYRSDKNFRKLRAEMGLVTKNRTCLRCSNIFVSSSSGNRICGKCTQNEATTEVRYRSNIGERISISGEM